MENIPVIRLEVQGMKHTMMVALQQYQVNLDADIQQAIADYLTEENVSRVVRESVRSAIELVLREEVLKFYQYGEGRKMVQQIIQSSLGES
jgi:hypothetical protein